MPPTLKRFGQRLLIAGGALAIGAALWLPVLSLLFRPARAEYLAPPNAVPALAQRLAEHQLSLWEDPAARAEEIARMRRTNAEWDFMARTFFVLSLANLSLRDPGQADRYLAVMDRVIAETEAIEAQEGHLHFLMDYARASPFVEESQRSVFVDGEIALMIGARRLVREEPAYADGFAERIAHLRRQMEAGPVHCGESYPNECWMFCNAVALAAMALSDALDGTDHRAFFDDWLASARENLIHRDSAMLVSSFTWEGSAIDGPEGSSIFMTAHCLRLIDAQFAMEQYALAREQLGFHILGFGLAREWPASWQGPMDVDSGPVVPVIGASAGASGLALLGAASFDDDAYLGRLVASLEFAAFPVTEDGRQRFAAANQVGDAVVLYALVEGPLWARILESQRETRP